MQAAALGVGKPDVLLGTGVYKWMPALPAVGNEVTGYAAAIGPTYPILMLVNLYWYLELAVGGMRNLP